MSLPSTEIVTRTTKCGEHGVEFVELYHERIPGQEPFWTGQCRECVNDERLSVAANAEVEKQHGQIAKEVFFLTQSRESEIEELAYREFDGYVARICEEARQLLPAFEAAVRQRIYTEAWEQVTDRIFSESVARLRAAGKQE